MDEVASALLLLLILGVILGLGVWIFAALLVVAVLGLGLLGEFPLERIGVIARSVMWRSATSWEYAAIPLFIWMGEIILRSTLSERLFRGLSPIVEWLPGRLLHSNVMGCTLFAAVSGSTAATTATVGRITTTKLASLGYDRSLSMGSLAGAGSLGLLIPPSIVLIIYGILAEVSIARLFIAGILPGLLVAGLFSTYIIIRCLIQPTLGPRGHESVGISQILGSVVDLWPFVLLVAVVMGSIYTGLATPSEAAAMGVAATIVICAATGELKSKLLFDSLMSAVTTSCMVCILLVVAAFLSSTLGYLHIPMNVANAIGAMGFSPLMLILMLSVFFIVLGTILDGISIIVMTLPITLPLILAAGYDPVWYGVFLVLMVELGLITPPVGLNLFVIRGITGRPLGEIAWASFPFFLIMCLAVGIITLQPQIVLWLPSMMQ